MKFSRLFATVSVILTIAAGAAHAADFKSVGAAPAVLYDAPGVKGRKVFVAPRSMPVEVVLTYGDWSKVRDAAGDLAWMESSALSPRRTVVVKVPNAKLHASSDEASAITFSADKGVVLDLVDPVVSGWIKVKHQDGQSGYIKVAEVWGA